VLNTKLSYSVIAAALLCVSAAFAEKSPMPTASFVQLHRGVAGKPASAWAADFKGMQKMGVDTLIVQWSAQTGIAYFSTENEAYTEQYDTVGRLLDAAAKADLTVYLGLHHDTGYWKQITARDRVIKDYFYVRTAQNIAVQKDLLERFADAPAWKGYYIPDEIDDLNWRSPERSGLMKRYLRQVTKHLRMNDAERDIIVSAFYRLRTAPKVFADNLKDLTEEADLAAVIVQDGLGDGIPWKYAERYVPEYYGALAKVWEGAENELWGVIEVFRRESDPNDPFVAVSTEPERAATQIDLAASAFSRLIYFTYLDYVHPDVSDASKALHQALQKRTK